MAIAQRKTLMGLAGLLTGVFLAAGLLIGLNAEIWWQWVQGWSRQSTPMTADQTHAALPVRPESGVATAHTDDLRLWQRLPAHSQVDLAMLGLTQGLQNLGLQVQTMQVMPDLSQASKDKGAGQSGPHVLLFVRLLGSYAQWVQWWETSRHEGVAWWPVQLSMSPAAGQARLQIEGQWRVSLGDQAQASGMWAHDVAQWVPANLLVLPDPFGLHDVVASGLTHSMPVQAPCAADASKTSLHGLRLVGVLQGSEQRPGQAVLSSGACQWVVRVGQAVGVRGHRLESLGPGPSVWLAREGQVGGVQLYLHLNKKERP